MKQTGHLETHNRRKTTMKRVSIGGQAVLEGIMMKGPDSYALAVRKPDKEIDVQVTPYKSLGEKHKPANIPIIRGVINFIESLYIGMSTLMKSSEYFEEEEEEKPKKASQKTEASAKTEKKDAAEAGQKDSKAGKESSAGDKASLVFTLIASLAIAIGVFMLLPAFIAKLIFSEETSSILVNLTEGVMRLVIFLLYVGLISKMEDIKRTFMYHGAEHKTINCLEAGDDLTVENVRKHTRFHKRCGTSFVFIVMIVSIVVFMFVRTETMWLRLLSRVLLIPVIAGISYEFIRYAGRHNNACSRVLSQPGLWVQRLTTKEPDDSMIEVAIKSVEAVIDWHEYVKCVREDSFEK
jgi:uncharacterized protein YqhQ